MTVLLQRPASLGSRSADPGTSSAPRLTPGVRLALASAAVITTLWITGCSSPSGSSGAQAVTTSSTAAPGPSGAPSGKPSASGPAPSASGSMSTGVTAPAPEPPSPASLPRVAFSPDSKRVFVGSGKTVEVVDLDPPARRKIGPMSAPISTIEPTPKGDFLAVGLEDGHATFYDTKEWKPGARVDAPSGGVTTVRVSRNGKTGVILGDSPKARLFRPDTGQVVRDVEPSMNPWDAGLSVDGKRVTLVDAASVTEWEVETGRKYIEEGVDTGGTFPIATSDDGAWAASSSEDGHALSLWGVHPWVKHPKLLHVDTCAQHVIGIRFSVDGKLLFATRLDGPRYAFKTETRAQRASWTPKPEKGELASAVMSEDADTVAASWTAGGTALYRTSDGAEIRSLDKGGPTQRLVFSMDGRHVLGVRDSGEVVVWSVVTGQEEAKIAPSK